MRYLKTYENYSFEDIKKALRKSKESGDISGDIDKVLNSFKKHEIGSFEDFVDSEGNFISEGNRIKIKEFIDRFKKMGFDVSKLEKNVAQYIRFREINYDLDNLYQDSDENIDDEENKLYDESDNLLPLVNEFETELKRIAKEAKKII